MRTADLEYKTSLTGHNGPFSGRLDDEPIRVREGDDNKHPHLIYSESNVTPNHRGGSSEGVITHAISPLRNERVKVTT